MPFVKTVGSSVMKDISLNLLLWCLLLLLSTFSGAGSPLELDGCYENERLRMGLQVAKSLLEIGHFEMQVPLDNPSESVEIVLNKGVCNILELYHLVEQLDNDNSSWKVAIQATLFQNILDANTWLRILDNTTTTSTLYRYCLYMKLAEATNSLRSAKDELSNIQSGRCINIDYLSEISWINSSSEISEEERRNILTTLLIE